MSARNVGLRRLRPHRPRPVRARVILAVTALGSLPAAMVALAAAALVLLSGVDRPGVLAAVMAVLAALTAGLTGWGAARLARGLLEPFRRLRRDLEGLDEADLGGRVGVPAAGDDAARLAGHVNRLLGRLESSAAQRRAFISDASHELRTPITGLRTRIELALGDAPEDGDAAETLRSSLVDIDRLHRIVDDLLVLARLDAGDPPARERVDLGALVEAEVARRRSTVPTAVKVEPGVMVVGNRMRLCRVVLNLLANAERYAGARIEVEARADGADAVVEVHDDGPGIPRADRDRVFERFARLDTARSRAAGGSGLGLPIARQIAVGHGGSLYVADGADGARLVLRLPLAR